MPKASITTKKIQAKKAAASVAAEASAVHARKSAAKKKAGSAAGPAVVAPTHHDIQMLAYHLWIQRGRQHGSDAQDWLRAEQQLQNG